jgi:uncharacterized membrane protein YeaQ/YmgE (transglycosylase-associated protein family)
MDFLWFLLIGLAAGWLAGQVMKSRRGLVGDLIVGVIGAVLGGWIFGVLGFHSHGLLAALIVATVGACVLLAALRFVKA